MKRAENDYAVELAAFKVNYERLKKYFGTLSREKKKSPEGFEISEILGEIERRRPTKTHWLLWGLFGGQLAHRLFTPAHQIAYKQEYERFKIIVTCGHLGLSIVLGIAILWKWPDFPVIYDSAVPLYGMIAYWIMIGREAVLKMNGSNIRGWWFAHHILSMILSAFMILWDKATAEYFRVRRWLFLFYIYIGAVQVLQYRYQLNRLYALRSLSRIDPMEITNELAQNVIHHNLLFLLPFLLVAYAAEFALALLIYASNPECGCWISCLIAALYFTLASGNTLTTGYTYYRKLMKCRIDDNDRGCRKRHILIVRQFTQSTEDLKQE